VVDEPKGLSDSGDPILKFPTLEGAGLTVGGVRLFWVEPLVIGDCGFPIGTNPDPDWANAGMANRHSAGIPSRAASESLLFGFDTFIVLPK